MASAAPSLTDARTALSAATKAASDADTFVATLLQRLRAGDGSVSGAQLAEARADAEVAHLRLDSLQAVSNEAHEVERSARGAALAAEFSTWQPDAMALVEKRVSAARAALADLLATVSAYSEEASGFKARARTIGEVSGVVSMHPGLGPILGGNRIQPLDSGEALAVACASAFAAAKSTAKVRILDVVTTLEGIAHVSTIGAGK